MSELVIKNGRLVLPDKIFEGDIAIDAGIISKVGKDLKGDKVVNAEGNYILPGLIDVHVHFREPGASSKEDWNTGSFAAASSGITTVLDMPNTQPPTTTVKLLDKKREIAASKSTVDFGFHFGASTENMDELRKVEKIASVKFYMSSTIGNLFVGNDAVLFEELKILAERDIPGIFHAENREMVQHYMQRLINEGRMDPEAYSDARPNICAAEAVNRIIFLSKMAKNRLHFCHVSTKEEVDIIARNKSILPLTAEVCPHHLFLNKEDLRKLGSLVKTNPPLRSKEDQNALWKGIQDGTIDVIATDHAPHLMESKEKDIWSAPAGVPGVETMLPLLLNEVNKGNLTLNQLVKLTSENPARIFRIKDKGKIKEGYDADLVIIDLKKEKKVRNDKLFTKCGWSPFDGWKLKGWPVMTFIRGNLIFDNGDINKIKGREVSYG